MRRRRGKPGLRTWRRRLPGPQGAGDGSPFRAGRRGPTPGLRHATRGRTGNEGHGAWRRFGAREGSWRPLRRSRGCGEGAGSPASSRHPRRGREVSPSWSRPRPTGEAITGRHGQGPTRLDVGAVRAGADGVSRGRSDPGGVDARLAGASTRPPALPRGAVVADRPGGPPVGAGRRGRRPSGRWRRRRGSKTAEVLRGLWSSPRTRPPCVARASSLRRRSAGCERRPSRSGGPGPGPRMRGSGMVRPARLAAVDRAGPRRSPEPSRPVSSESGVGVGRSSKTWRSRGGTSVHPRGPGAALRSLRGCGAGSGRRRDAVSFGARCRGRSGAAVFQVGKPRRARSGGTAGHGRLARSDPCDGARPRSRSADAPRATARGQRLAATRGRLSEGKRSGGHGIGEQLLQHRRTRRDAEPATR